MGGGSMDTIDVASASSSSSSSSFSPFEVQDKFKNFRLQEEYDTHDYSANLYRRLPFLRKRSKIFEIVAAKDVIFALAQSGICAAFSRTSNTRICFLNIIPDELIRSIFYNKYDESLITVSVYALDRFSLLKCRTTPIKYIEQNQLHDGTPLFESESLRWPGFIEFDDVNGKVLTYSAKDSVYKVFDLKDYSFLYAISDKRIEEINISQGIMLLKFARAVDFVPFKLLSIEDGTVLKSFHHLVHPDKNVSFIEQFNEKLLIKQENENLQILDVWNSEVTEIRHTEFLTPSAFIFLYKKDLLLTLQNRTLALWNLQGEIVSSFEDHLLWDPGYNNNNIYITNKEDLIISYCKSDGAENGECGSININNILTGKCIAKICPCDPGLPISPRGRMGGRSWIESTAPEALEDVTAIFYDEDHNEVYTGNRKGLVHVWSNAPISSNI